MTEKSFENWDCVEVRERYHQAKEKKEAAKALEDATRAYVIGQNRKTIHDFVDAIDSARRAGISGTEISAVISAASEEERRKKEALKGGFSHETPRVNEGKEAKKESEKGGATIGYERKTQLLVEGWEEIPEYPDILYKTIANLTFLEDTRDGRSWISRHREVEE